MSLPATNYEWFGEQVRRLLGIDLRCYKSQQMERRLQTIMHRFGVRDYAAFVQLLRRDATALAELKDFITINVSEFFRNQEKFDELRNQVLPELLRERRALKVWSAGCSRGMEIYSLAILLSEVAPAGRHRLLATDLDEAVLAEAKAGIYGDRDVANVSPQRLERHFRRLPDGRWEIAPRLKSNISFQCHNLLTDPFGDDFDLIACRNVVIYFTEPVKASLYQRFFSALRPGGVLFVGGTESILNAREVGLEPFMPFFYRRPAAPARVPARGIGGT